MNRPTPRPISTGPRARWSTDTRRLALVGLACAFCLIIVTGCGQQWERLIRLATFEMIAEDEEGPIFMAMVRAYYEVDQGEIDAAADAGNDPQTAKIENDSPPTQVTPASRPARFHQTGISTEEEAALRALVRIQAIDASEPQPLPAVMATWEAADWWDHLTVRSRHAFAARYPAPESTE